MSTKPLVVPAEPRQYDIAEEHMRVRSRPKRAAGVRDERLSADNTSVEIDCWGALAEVVVAELLGQEAESYDQVDGDDGYDFVWNGRTVQVKWANHPDLSGFRPVKDKAFTADLGILACPLFAYGASPKWRELPHVHIAGWTDQKHWLEKKRLTTIKTSIGPQWVLERGDLRLMRDLGVSYKRMNPAPTKAKILPARTRLV